MFVGDIAPSPSACHHVNSNSKTFQDEFDADIVRLNAASACLDAATNRAGVFSGQKDSQGFFICDGADGGGTSLSSGHSGTNQQVLVAAFPMAFNSNREAFAELVAVVLGNTDRTFLNGMTKLESLDWYYQGNQAFGFYCGQTYVRYVMETGQIPTANDYPANFNCPAK